jgi:hypothetical protein
VSWLSRVWDLIQFLRASGEALHRNFLSELTFTILVVYTEVMEMLAEADFKWVGHVIERVVSYCKALFPGLGDSLMLELGFNAIRDNETRASKNMIRTDSSLHALWVSALSTMFADNANVVLPGCSAAELTAYSNICMKAEVFSAEKWKNGVVLGVDPDKILKQDYVTTSMEQLVHQGASLLMALLATPSANWGQLWISSVMRKYVLFSYKGSVYWCAYAMKYRTFVIELVHVSDETYMLQFDQSSLQELSPCVFEEVFCCDFDVAYGVSEDAAAVFINITRRWTLLQYLVRTCIHLLRRDVLQQLCVVVGLKMRGNLSCLRYIEAILPLADVSDADADSALAKAQAIYEKRSKAKKPKKRKRVDDDGCGSSEGSSDSEEDELAAQQECDEVENGMDRVVVPETLAKDARNEMLYFFGKNSGSSAINEEELTKDDELLQNAAKANAKAHNKKATPTKSPKPATPVAKGAPAATPPPSTPGNPVPPTPKSAAPVGPGTPTGPATPIASAPPTPSGPVPGTPGAGTPIPPDAPGPGTPIGPPLPPARPSEPPRPEPPDDTQEVRDDVERRARIHLPTLQGMKQQPATAIDDSNLPPPCKAVRYDLKEGHTRYWQVKLPIDPATKRQITWNNHKTINCGFLLPGDDRKKSKLGPLELARMDVVRRTWEAHRYYKWDATGNNYAYERRCSFHDRLLTNSNTLTCVMTHTYSFTLFASLDTKQRRVIRLSVMATFSCCP